MKTLELCGNIQCVISYKISYKISNEILKKISLYEAIL